MIRMDRNAKPRACEPFLQTPHGMLANAAFVAAPAASRSLHCECGFHQRDAQLNLASGFGPERKGSANELYSGAAVHVDLS